MVVWVDVIVDWLLEGYGLLGEFEDCVWLIFDEVWEKELLFIIMKIFMDLEDCFVVDLDLLLKILVFYYFFC